jgi:O-antigen/teichoic acid export membrane protein
MASLSDKAALLILANAIKYAVGFALPMIFVRLLTQEEYGTYQQLTLVSNICTGIMVLGLPTSLYYFYHRKNDSTSGRPTLIAQTQILLLFSGVITAAAVALAAPLIAARMNNESLRSLLPLYSLYVGLFIAGEHFLHVMISQNRYAMAVGLEAVETAFRVAALVILLALGYALQAIVIMLVIYALLRLIGRSYWLWHGPDAVTRANWTERFPASQFAYSLPLAASTCVGLIGGLLDRLIVATTFTPADYAVYSVGALEIPLDVIFQASVLNVLRASFPPLVKEGKIDEVIRIWRDSVRKLALIIVPSFVFLVFFADRFILTLFTKAYEDSVDVFRIYLFLLPMHMLVLSVVPQVYGRTKLNLYVVATAVAVNAALSLVLLRFIGILGPAVAFIVSAYVSSVLYFIVTMRLLNAKPSQLLPMIEVGRTLVAAMIAVTPAWGFATLIDSGLVALAVGGTIFGIVYLIAGYFLRIFNPADIRTARSWIRRIVPAS